MSKTTKTNSFTDTFINILIGLALIALLLTAVGVPTLWVICWYLRLFV